MDLSYGEEHERFRQEVRDFLEKHREVAPPPWLGGIVAFKNEKVLSWQRLLVEHGYAARTIPKSTAVTAPSRIRSRGSSSMRSSRARAFPAE
jgi:alkylation response protein AidB-like acyl-CoA dehydrogenase